MRQLTSGIGHSLPVLIKAQQALCGHFDAPIVGVGQAEQDHHVALVAFIQLRKVHVNGHTRIDSQGVEQAEDRANRDSEQQRNCPQQRV
ncbi:MAG: hypothetical protein D6749_05025 [Chloroflexota bacterium]|nr:MAG: hypothetical protein D6749_05025 [Chloroflexota bacterium]